MRIRQERPVAAVVMLVSPRRGDLAQAAKAGGLPLLRLPLRAQKLRSLLRSRREGDPARSPASAPERPLLSARVLVAEDNPVNQMVTARMLSHIGCVPTIVSNGRAAVEKALSEPFDIILMDCQMPEMDGFEASRALRDALGGRRLPIVALTANAMQGDRERCLSAGMDDYLTKPMQLETLAAALHRWTSPAAAESMPASAENVS